MPLEIDYLGEGRSDEAVARKLIIAAAGRPGTSFRRPLAGDGKSSLDRRLPGLNAGVVFRQPVLVLRDLDHDAQCAAALVARLLPNRHSRLILRVCVREAEAWLMADVEAYAKYCGVSPGVIPSALETLADPKAMILRWVDSGRAAKLARHVEAGRRIGTPDWAILGEWHADFAAGVWSPRRAVSEGRSPSLTRALERLKAFVASA